MGPGLGRGKSVVNTPSRALWIGLAGLYAAVVGAGIALLLLRVSHFSALTVIATSVGALAFLLLTLSATIAAVSRQTFMENPPRSAMHYVAIWWPLSIWRARRRQRARIARAQTAVTAESVVDGSWTVMAARGVGLLLIVAAVIFAVVAVIAFDRGLAGPGIFLSVVACIIAAIGVAGITNARRAVPSDFATITRIRKPFPFWLIDRMSERGDGTNGGPPRDS